MECTKQPKFKSYKNFHISDKADLREHGGLVLHEVFSKRFKEGIVVEMADGAGNCVRRENFK